MGKTLGQVAHDTFIEAVWRTIYSDWEAVAAAVVAEHERRKWKPIATAPKDGTIVLVHRHGCVTPFLAAWLDGAAINQPGWHHVDINKRFHSTPTHWQSVPEGPQEADHG